MSEKPSSSWRVDRWLIGVIGLFAMIFLSVAIWQHNHFRTHTYDLGIFDQAVWSWSQGRAPVITSRIPARIHQLADHFTPGWALLSLLYVDTTELGPDLNAENVHKLFVAQVVAWVICGLGLLWLMRDVGLSDRMRIFVILLFCTAMGIQSTMLFHVHDIVFGMAAIPWIFLFARRKKWWLVALLCLELFVWRETFGIFLMGFGIYLAVEHRKWSRLWVSAAGVAILVLLLKAVIPSFQPSGAGYEHWFYGQYASGPLELVKFAILHPWQILVGLFDDPRKVASVLYFLITGAALLVWKKGLFPLWFVLIMERNLSSTEASWGFGFQYMYEPQIIGFIILILAWPNSKVWWEKVRQRKWFERHTHLMPALATTLVGILITVHVAYSPILSTLSTPPRYTPDQEATLYRYMRMIPATAAVSTEYDLAPHLSARAEIYRIETPYGIPDYILAVKRGAFDGYTIVERSGDIALWKKSE